GAGTGGVPAGVRRPKGSHAIVIIEWKCRTAMTIGLMCVAGAVTAQTPQHLALHDAEQRALANHPRVRAAQYSAEASEEAVKETRSAYFPAVSASMTGAEAESGSRIAAGGLNNPIILDRFAGGVSFGEMLTDFGRTRALVQSASLHADAMQQGVTNQRADILLQLDRAYFNSLRAQAVENVAQETVTARQLVVDQVTAEAASGLKSGLDLSFAHVNLSQAQILLVQARNDLESAFTALSAALGSSDYVTYDLVDEPLPAEPPPDGAALVAQALRDRPDVATGKLSQRAALKFADAQNLLWLPSISLVGAFGVAPYRQVGLNSRYSAIGVNLTLPVTTGGLNMARRAEAAFAANSEEQRLHDLENAVARDVRTAWLDAQASFRRLDLARELQSHAADAMDLAQTRYDNGLGSIVELTQAQLNKTQADIEAATARYDCQIRTAALNYQIGALK
ncbi:MAG: TolC family protein, partial [Vicinamibacterales bacterium]